MATVKDPICGKDVDTLRARAVGIFGGVTYYFCSQECKSKFVDPRKTPRHYSTPPSQPGAQTPTGTQTGTAAQASARPRTDPSLDLPPMAQHSSDDDEPLPDLTPAQPRPLSSPSVMADVRDLKKSSRRWTIIIVVLVALAVAAAVLSLRS